MFPYVHDFGSILAFTENNFGAASGPNCGSTPNNLNNFYADYYAPDNQHGEHSAAGILQCQRLAFVHLDLLFPYGEADFQAHGNWTDRTPTIATEGKIVALAGKGCYGRRDAPAVNLRIRW